MVTHTPLHRCPTSRWLAFLSLTYGALVAIFAMPVHLTRQRVVQSRRSHAPPSRITLIRASTQLATILSHISPHPRRIKHASSATIHLCPGMSSPTRIFLSLRSFRATSQVQIHIDCSMLYNMLHLPLGDRHPHGLHDLSTTRTHIPVLSHKPGPPHHSPLGGGYSSPPRVHNCLEEALETEPLPTPPPISTIGEWTQMLLTHTHEEFATLALL